MDTSAQSKTVESSAAQPEVLDLGKGAELQSAPVAAEASQGGPRADDGVAAQAQIAAVTADDQAATASTDAPPASSTKPAPPPAAEVDVIEPVWVKKAEEAVAAHRDDPHAQDEAVGDVQAEYLKQRYGIDVLAGEDGP